MKFQKGNKGFLGRKHSEETKAKMRKPKPAGFGERLSMVKKGKPRLNMRGKNHPLFGTKRPPETLRKMSESLKGLFSGEKHHNWQGGITPLVLKIRTCFLYRQWRSDVFTRDSFTCVLCGIVGVALDADHFPKTFAQIFHENKIESFEEAVACEEFWNINNGRTLCKKCHRETPTSKGGFRIK